MAQQNSGQQVLWVLLRVSQANLSKIQPGKIKEWKAGENKPPDTAALKYWLGCRQPDRWREQQEADGGGHDDALDRLIRAQDEALAADK
jgi:hypothetical protein